MYPRLNKQRFPLGLVVFALALAAYKAAMLAGSVGAGWQMLASLAGLDLFYLSFLLLLAILTGYAKNRLLRIPAWFVLVFMTAIYLVDSFVLLALDEHANLFDIGRYSLEAGVVLSFFDAAAYTALALLALALFVRWDFTAGVKKMSIILFVLALLTGVATAFYAPAPLLRYAMLNPAGLLENFGRQAALTAYSDEQIAFYADLQPAQVVLPAARPNIILVVVESLSAINSYKTSGVGKLLGGFDKLAEEGLLFRNFFANHQASEGGIIALLGGFPPMHFPTATPYMFDEFAALPAVIEAYREQGYFTEFMTNSDLGFIGLDQYLEGIGVDRSRGRDDFESLRTARRVVQAAPADDVLYAEALAAARTLANAQAPYLLVLATTSTHLPYTHPRDGADTAAAVWQWSLQQLTEFYQGLEKSGYFEDGILLVTGDHRQMRPVTEKETERYGDSARARVPLLVIGKGYLRGGTDDRFFQQSDLLRMLGRITQAAATLSPHPIWVERYNRKYGRIELIDKLSVFDQADQGRHEYRINASGNHIEWLGEKPGFARTVEARIHAQRSRHQKLRN